MYLSFQRYKRCDAVFITFNYLQISISCSSETILVTASVRLRIMSFCHDVNEIYMSNTGLFPMNIPRLSGRFRNVNIDWSNIWHLYTKHPQFAMYVKEHWIVKQLVSKMSDLGTRNPIMHCQCIICIRWGVKKLSWADFLPSDKWSTRFSSVSIFCVCLLSGVAAKGVMIYLQTLDNL